MNRLYEGKTNGMLNLSGLQAYCATYYQCSNKTIWPMQSPTTGQPYIRLRLVLFCWKTCKLVSTKIGTHFGTKLWTTQCKSKIILLIYYLLDYDNYRPCHACLSCARRAGTPASPQTLTVPNTHTLELQFKDLYKRLDAFLIASFEYFKLTMNIACNHLLHLC